MEPWGGFSVALFLIGFHIDWAMLCGDVITHRPPSNSFLGLRYRNLNANPKKELLGGLWVMPS